MSLDEIPNVIKARHYIGVQLCSVHLNLVSLFPRGELQSLRGLVTGLDQIGKVENYNARPT